MKWCVLIKLLGIKEPLGILADVNRFDYFGESEECIVHDFGLDSQIYRLSYSLKECIKVALPFWKWRYEERIELVVPAFVAEIIFLRNTIRANKAFDEYCKRIEE